MLRKLSNEGYFNLNLHAFLHVFFLRDIVFIGLENLFHTGDKSNSYVNVVTVQCL